MGLRTALHPFMIWQNDAPRSAMTRRRTRSMRIKTSMLSASFSAKLWRFLTVISTLYSICSYASSMVLCILKRLRISLPVDQKITSVRLSTNVSRR